MGAIMSWVTFIWSVLVGGYVVIALPQLLIGIWQRRLPPFLFVVACAAITFVAISELLTMRSHSVEFVIELLRWEQLAFFIFTIALVGFVFSYLGSGRIWLGLLVCASRTLCLILNFIGQVNLHFQQITGLRELRFLGEMISVPVGVISPRTHFSTFTKGLVFVFVIVASLTLWRQGYRDGRRRAFAIGGSVVAAMLIAQAISLLIHYRVLDFPYLTSLPFALILLAMAFELSLDLFRAHQIAEKLRVSEVALREFEEEMRIKREEISRLNRISLLGEMTASIAHELNQPLAAIVSNADAGQRFLDKGELAPQTMVLSRERRRC
jgi:two-component system sensor kinase FixL